MAGGDINIVINSETKAFKFGVESGIIDPLEDAERALEDLGRSRGLTDLERGLGDVDTAVSDIGRNTGLADLERGLKDSEDAAEKLGGTSGPTDLERELKDTQRETEELASETKKTAAAIESQYRKAGKDIEKGVGAGLDDAKSEAKQSGTEAAASFSGEWTDVGDFLQETVANGMSGFGPIGVAAGIAGAAGIGIITETILGQQEAADELKARLASAYQTAVEEGRNYLDQAQLFAEASDLMFNADRANEWKQVQEDALALGLDTNTVIAANAGATDEQREVQERINALLEDENSSYTSIREGTTNVKDEVKSLADRWGTVIDATEEQKSKVEALSEFQKDAERAQRDEIKRTADASQARYEAMAKRAKNPIEQTIVVNVDDSAWRHYNPPQKFGNVRAVVGGQVGWQ